MIENSKKPRNTGSPPEDHPLQDALNRLQDGVQAVLDKVEQLDASTDSNALLTRQEAANRLRISTRTLDDLEASGRLRAIRIGRRVLYHPDTLDAFIRQRSREGRR